MFFHYRVETKYLSSVCVVRVTSVILFAPCIWEFFLGISALWVQKQCWASSVFLQLLLWLIIAHFSEGGKYFLQLLPLNWKVVFESVFCENVETKFKWRSRRVSDNFQKLLWRHFYGDKSCVICWVMRHIFDKLLKDEWMSTLDLRQAQIITGCKGICWKFKSSSEPSEQCLFWMVGWQSVYFC